MISADNTGKVIAFLRHYRGWTQNELAEKLGITGKTVSKWENGGGYPDITLLPEIAQLFGVTVDFIMMSGENLDISAFEANMEKYGQQRDSTFMVNDKLRKQAADIGESSRIDERLYTEYDVKKGLRDINGNGVRAGLTKISYIHAKGMEDGKLVPVNGKLYYRGVDVDELINNYRIDSCDGFEEAAYLLLFGKLPTSAELAGFRRQLAAYRTLPTNFVRDVILKAPNTDIMNSMSKSILTLSSYDTNLNELALPNVLRQCLQLIAVFPLLAIYGYQAVAHYKNSESLIIHNPDPGLSTAENILRLMRNDGKFTKTEATVLDIALILHAEHGGGNNSSFTTHVVTSAGTDTYAAMTAALCSLKGPKHGGANLKVVGMMDEIKKKVGDWKDDDEVRAYVDKLLAGEAYDRSGLVYGLGHAVYSLSDPRELILKKFVGRLSAEKGLTDEFALYDSVERIAAEQIAKKRRIYKGVSANVDFYSGFAYRMLGIPEGLFTPIFAIARVTGWSAHRMEELINAGKIIRPEYKSIFEPHEYRKIDER